MFSIVFSLDYEIHGNGDGDPIKLMVEPTYRLIKLLDSYGAKLTIFADVAEIIKFKEYYEETGIDKFAYLEIINQLKTAILSGHDVQLHIHSSYLNAIYKNGKWDQNWDEYNLANLPFARIDSIIKGNKQFLEDLLQPINKDYKCNVFRAANWSMMPSINIVTALIKNGFDIDSSVFKYGTRSGRVNFDYTNAKSNLLPWFINSNCINEESEYGKLLEVPIYSESRNLFAFLTPLRMFRIIRAKFHKHKRAISEIHCKSTKKKTNIIKKIRKKYSWKLDFNQATGKMIIKACKRIEKEYSCYNGKIPIVLIGHSKTFVKINEFFLRPFLKYVSNDIRYKFILYRDIESEKYRIRI